MPSCFCFMIKKTHTFWCFLQNNIRGGEMLFKQKSQGVSQSIWISNISTPRRLFFNNHKNKYFISILPQQKQRANHFPLQKNEVGRSVTSFLYKTVEKAVPCCTLLTVCECSRLVFIIQKYSFSLMYQVKVFVLHVHVVYFLFHQQLILLLTKI